MQGIYTHIPETNNVPKQHNVPAMLSLLFMVPISLAAALALMYFYISTFTKSFFPNISDRLKAKINVIPNFTTVLTGHGNIKSYLYTVKILGSPVCSCKSGEQTVDHTLYECKLLEQGRDRLKAAVLRSENWPVNKNRLINEYNKYFTIFTNNIHFDKL
jgi:hypothetical protein